MSAEATRYPGTSSFRDAELDRKLFKGREKEKTVFFHRVLVEPLVVLYAQSGCGKTSLINAGLMEPLRQERYFPVVVRVNDPSAGFLSTVIQGVQDAAKKAELECQVGDTSSLWSFFKGLEVWRGDYLLTPVVVFDQFEEIFTLHSPESRAAFVSQFADLVRGRGDGGAPALKIVMSLREDYLGDLEELSQAIPNILNNRLRLLPLNRDDARSAIEEPAALMDDRIASAPFEYTPGTVDRILEFLSRKRSPSGRGGPQEIQPFQLQLICQNVEHLVQSAQKTGSRVTIDYQKDLHGDAGVQLLMQGFYERQMREVSHRSWRSRRHLQRLCETGLISARGRRLNLEEAHIKDTFEIEPETLAVLVKRRLLRAEPRGADTFYELSHDTLVEPILDSRRARRRKRALRVGAVSALTIVVLATSWWAVVNSRSYQVGEALRRGQALLPEITEPDMREEWAIALAMFGEWDKALSAANGLEDPIKQAETLIELTHVQFQEEGKANLAGSLWERTHSAVMALDNLRMRARLLARLSSELAKRGESMGADDLFQEAIETLESFREESSYPEDVPAVRVSVAMELDPERQAAHATHLLEFALEEADKLARSAPDIDMWHFVKELSPGFAKFGDVAKADPAWLIARFGAKPDDFDRINLFYDIALQLQDSGHKDKAREYQEKAIQAVSTSKDFSVFGEVGQSLIDGGDQVKSIEILKDAIRTATSYDALTAAASGLIAVDSKAALEAVRSSSLGLPSDRLRFYVNAASILIATGKASDASPFVDTAKRELEQMEKAPVSAQESSSVSNTDHDSVVNMEATLLGARGEIREAIAMAARAREPDFSSIVLLHVVQAILPAAGRENLVSGKRDRLKQAREVADHIVLENTKDEAFHQIGLACAAWEMFGEALDNAAELREPNLRLQILTAILRSEVARRNRPT